MSSQEKLHKHIVALSRSKSWASARTEWELNSIFQSDEPQTCPCGQHPIFEICVIRNRVTGQATEVGNVCVNNFLMLPSTGLFRSIRYVREDGNRSFSEEMIEYAHDRDIINDWERKFSLSIRKKRRLSGSQRNKKTQVNAKILTAITR